jgi:Ca-activated chloride channel homolog
VRGLALGIAVALVLGAGPANQALGQQSVTTPGSPQVPVFRSVASLVALNGTVTDGRHFISGLRSEDFEVFEDNVRQQVEFFETRQVPLDLILLVDSSSSMSDKVDVVREAALGFVGTLRPIDRGAVIAFSDGVTILEPMTADRGALEAAIKKTNAHGGTALNNALYVALKEFGRPTRVDGQPVRRQAIALLSDGADTTSLIGFDDVLALARKSDVSIYTISLQSKATESQRAADRTKRFFSDSDYALKTLAIETGAQAFFPDFLRDLKGVYGKIAEELSNQYSIAYAPTDTRVDGRFRRIVVRLRSRPELQPRFRTGYVADAARSFMNLLRGG